MSGTQIKITPYLAHKMRVISLFAICFVVLQHASYGVATNNALGLVYRDIVSLGIADFPVPYFFVVSGFFFMKRFDGTFRWYNSELIKRIKTLLLPYFIFCTLGILLCRSYPYKTLLDDYGITSLVTVVGALWYVRTLFVLCILSPLLILVVMAFTHFKTLRDIFLFALPFLLILRLPCQSSVVAPIIYFTFGLFLSRYGTCFANVTAKRKITWACILAGLLMIAKISYTFNSPEAEPILRKAMIPEYLIIIWYGYDLLYNNIPKFRKHSESIPEIILNATFFIYCMELFLRMFWQRALFAPLRIQTILNSPIGPFILTLLVVSSGMMLAKFLDRFAPKLYAILSGGRG